MNPSARSAAGLKSDASFEPSLDAWHDCLTETRTGTQRLEAVDTGSPTAVRQTGHDSRPRIATDAGRSQERLNYRSPHRRATYLALL
jgi:hypothetical protein